MVISERSERIESSHPRPPQDGFTAYKGTVQALLHGKGWSARGVFCAFMAFRVHDAYGQGETPEALASRIDRDAPLGMAIGVACNVAADRSASKGGV